MLTRHHLREAARLMNDYKNSPDLSTDCRWIQALNADQFRAGSLFGWRDESSPTGFLSGFVVESDPRSLRVLVRDIMPGKL